jgi:RecA-family ATPase
VRYDWAAFQVLLQAASQPTRHYPRLDLTQTVPQTDWLVEDFLVRSEAAALVGDGGVGKSFITMALALAVAGGDKEFLGMPLKAHGPVLYVDEENSMGLVLQRLHALGFEPDKHLPNLEYLWYAGVDLLNEPEKLLEEALDLEPVLVIADSLSRVAIGADENSNTDMTRLMRQGVIPIARETGAAVVLVHHTARDGNGPRGATSIRNSADQVITAKQVETTLGPRINLYPSKPRRQTASLQVELDGDMEKDGYIRVNNVQEDTPF